MARLILVLAVCVCTSCARPDVSPTAALTVSERPDVAYQRAVRTLTRMGGLVATSDPHTHTIEAHMQGTRIITVQITPTEGGSRLQARGQVALAWASGLFSTSLAEDFLKAYQATP